MDAQLSEIITQDILFFFDGKPVELSLYERLAAEILGRWPSTEIQVKKTQISFCEGRMFACASLTPVRRKVDRPDRFLTVSFGLPAPLDDPRALPVEVRPNRWTHHVIVGRAEEIDDQLLDWIGASRRLSRRGLNAGCVDSTDLRWRNV